jgi:DNA/RNA endonuclease YhcR with UshA esterase domain
MGIIFLFVFAQAIETEKMDIVNIDKSTIGSNIEVFVSVVSYYASNGDYFLKVSDNTGNIMAVLFKNEAGIFDVSKLKKGQKIKITGKVSEYKGNLEIIAYKIDFIYK